MCKIEEESEGRRTIKDREVNMEKRRKAKTDEDMKSNVGYTGEVKRGRKKE